MARAQYGLPCQWQQEEVEAPEADIPARPRPGQEKRGNLGAAREAIKGSRGNFLELASAAPSSLESNGVDPASAGTRYGRHWTRSHARLRN